MSQILSGGRSDRLYQALVEKGLAQSAYGEDDDNRDPYLMTFNAIPSAGVSNDTVEKAMEAEIARLQTTPVSDDELKRAIRQTEAEFVYQNESVSEQAEQIGRYAVIGFPHYLSDYLDRVRQITPADIQRVAKQYFTADNRTVAFFEPQPLPPGSTPPPPPVVDNFGAAKPVTDPRQKAVLAALDKKFNTTTKTTALAERPKPTRVVLPNGLTVVIEENHADQKRLPGRPGSRRQRL